MSLKQKLKKFIMLRSLKKQKKNSPLDIDSAEKFSLSKNADAFFNNSYYLTAHDDNIRLYLRLGQRGNGVSEVWVKVQNGDKSYVALTSEYESGNAPLTVKCVELQKEWLHAYKGIVSDGKNEVNLELLLTFTGTAPIYDFFTHGNDELSANAYSKVKWDKDFQKNAKKSKQTHYEQYGELKGVVKIGEKEIKIAGIPAVRDHSFGMRDWSFMLRHIWLCGLNKNGKAFNVSMVSYPIAKGILAGNVYEGDEIVNFSGVEFKGDVINGGKGADALIINITTVKGESVTIKGKRVSETVYPMQNGEYFLREGFGDFTLNGENYKGIWEFGFNKNSELW